MILMLNAFSGQCSPSWLSLTGSQYHKYSHGRFLVWPLVLCAVHHLHFRHPFLGNFWDRGLYLLAMSKMPLSF